MKTNLFDVLNPNFFGVLSGVNKASNFLLIIEVSDFFGGQVVVERKRLVDYIADKIKNLHIEDVGDDSELEIDEYESEDLLNKYNRKSNAFIAFLEKRGWLDRDRDAEFIDIDSRSDAFLEIFDSLMRLIQDETDAKEQSTALLSLYRNIKNFDYKNATSSVESIEIASKDLSKSILSINSKIKRFVDRAMSDTSLGEKDILNKLTIDYQRLSAYISFHNLLTKNNPNKYSNDIINKLYDLQLGDSFEQIIDDYCITKALNKDDEKDRLKAKQYIGSVFDTVFNQIQEIEGSLNAISRRNYSYVSSSADRINFRLNNERDIKADINNALKGIKSACLDSDFETEFDFYSFDQTDNKSIYTARSLAKIAPKETNFIKHEVNSEAMAKAELLIKQREMFSIKSVDAFVNEQLGEKEEMLASQLVILNLGDFIKLMLIPVFSTNSESSYFVKKNSDDKFECLEYMVDDYLISRRRAKQNDKK